MKRGKWCALVLALLLGSAVVYAGPPSARPDTRTFLLESAGGLGGGVGFAAVALPFTLAYYLFSPGDVAPVLGVEGVCLGLGSAAGACWTGRGLGNPTKFWPALGMALLPQIGTGLVMVLTRKGPDLSDPVVAGCSWASVIASPVLATVGANLGRHVPGSEVESRLRVVPEFRACSASPHPAAGLGLTLAF
ncbi:hypothetical protein JXD38_07565 [candidate division WOR-3 bacterium]|nr:hypothetical protein [candidate division WOR-3 bacterium]